MNFRKISLRSFSSSLRDRSSLPGALPWIPIFGSTARSTQETAVTDRQPLSEILQGVFENSQVELPGKIERQNKLSFVVSDEELEILNTARGGIKLSEYIRSVLFKQPPRIPRASVPAINREILVQLNRIGSLLNQQTKALNVAKIQNSFDEISLEYLQHYLDRLSELERKLRELGRAIVLLNAGNRSEDDWENL